jgi:hypothetical protein
MTTIRSQARLQQNLAEITRLLERHRVLGTLTHRQEGPRRDLLENLQRRQNLVESILEGLPLDDRRIVVGVHHRRWGSSCFWARRPCSCCERPGILTVSKRLY